MDNEQRKDKILTRLSFEKSWVLRSSEIDEELNIIVKKPVDLKHLSDFSTLWNTNNKIHNRIIVHSLLINQLNFPVKVENVLFTCDVDIIDLTNSNYIRFVNCEFKNFQIKNSRLSGVYFEKNSIVGHFRIMNSETGKYLIIKSSKFFKNTYFNNVEFEKLELESIIFKGAVKFIGCRTNPSTPVLWSDVKFESGIDVSRSEITKTLIPIHVTVISNHLKKIYPLYSDKGFTFHTEKEKASYLSYSSLKESYRKIKSHLRLQDNFIEAAQFDRLEKLAHLYELKYATQRNKFNRQSRFLLKFNELTNRFGNSISRPLVLTVLVSFGLFSICVLILWLRNDVVTDFSEEGISNFIGGYISFFNITDWSQDYFHTKPFWLVMFITVVGKILTGVGIFQFIQSARKWNKK